MTKRLLSPRATAVVTTKMINPQQEGSPETPPLPVVLAAILGEPARAPGDTCLPWATGRAGSSPTGIG